MTANPVMIGGSRRLGLMFVVLLFAIHFPWVLGRNWGFDLTFVEVWDEQGRIQGAILQGAFIALAILWTLARIARTRERITISRVERILLLYGIYAVFSAIYGLILGNSVVYVIGDLYQLELFVVGYLLCRVWVREHQLEQFAFWLLVSVSIPIAIDLISVVLTGNILSVRYGLGKHLLALLFLIPLTLDIKRPRPAHVALLALAMVNLALTLSKGLVLLVPFVIAFHLFFLTSTSLARANLRLMLGLILGGILLATLAGRGVSYAGLQLLESWKFRVGSFWEEKYDYYSVSGRMEEIRAITGDVTTTSLVVGKGLGATYTLEVANSLKVEKHYVHILFGTLLLRQGLPGVVLFVWLSWALMVASVRRVKRMPPTRRRAVAAGAFLVFLGHLGISMYASGVFYTNGLILGVLAGVTLAEAVPFSAAAKRSQYLWGARRSQVADSIPLQ